MRLRNVPNAFEKLAASDNYIRDPQSYKGHWHEYFGNINPVHTEIGSGKGRFITDLAQQNPDINYIALEKYPSVLLKLIRKIPENGLKNLAVISLDAEKLEEVFENGEIEKLYLNFSDPWPKKKHIKRRLTSPNFLELYKRILTKGSVMEFKTDNRGLFDYSVNEIRKSGFMITKITYDLYSSDLLGGNTATEYEEKFHQLGTPINKLIARLEDAGTAQKSKPDIKETEK